MYKSLIIFIVTLVNLNASHALTLMPLTSWIKDKDYTTLSVEDTILVTQRCMAAYRINISFFSEFSNYDPKKLKDTFEKYSWVNSRFAILKVVKNKDKVRDKNYADKFIKSLLQEEQEIYDAYLEIMRNNQPIPHSLNSELLATDIGVCNKIDSMVFDAYQQMKKHEESSK